MPRGYVHSQLRLLGWNNVGGSRRHIVNLTEVLSFSTDRCELVIFRPALFRLLLSLLLLLLTMLVAQVEQSVQCVSVCVSGR